MNSFVRFGVVGLGHWGPNIVRNILGHKRANLACVCDREQSAIEIALESLPRTCSHVTNPSLMFTDPEIDAVVIVTPSSTHYGLVREALLAGKHVLCEKPLALTTEQNTELCDIARNMGRHLMVGHTFLFNDSVRKLAELVRSGHLGDIYYIAATRTHLGLIRTDVGAVWDLAPHDVAVINYLLGETPRKVSATGMRLLTSDREDAAFLTLFYPGDKVAQIHVSWVDSSKERLLSIIGSSSKVVFNDLSQSEPIRIFEKGIDVANYRANNFGEFQFLVRDGDIVSPKIKCREPLSTMIDSFIRVVLDGAENISDARFALSVTKTIVAALKSINAFGVPFPV